MQLEQMCQSNRAKWPNRGCFCIGAGRGRKHRCPVSYWPIKQHTDPEGRKLLLTRRHQEKRTFQSTHTHTHMQHYTHTTKVDKIFQVSGPAPRDRTDLQRPVQSNTQPTNTSFNVTQTCWLCWFILQLHTEDQRLLSKGRTHWKYS